MSRLPKVGGDDDSWGDVLNDFLGQAHNGDGSLKSNSVGAPQLKPNAVTTSSIADGQVVTSKLADGAVGTDQLADAAVSPAKLLGAGTANGLATLDDNGLLPEAQIPARLSESELAATIATTNGYVLVASDTAPADTTRYGVPVLWLDTNEVVAATPVNPPVPTWSDATSKFTVPSGVVGVDYVWTSGGGGVGAILTQGAIESTSGSFPRSVVITPVAQQGYVLASGVTTFNHSFPDPNPALTTVITSDTFTGPAGTISGRNLDLGLGGSAATWSTSASTKWTTDGSGDLLFADPAGTGGSFSIPLNGSLSARNMKVEFDLTSVTGSANGSSVGLSMALNTSPGYNPVVLYYGAHITGTQLWTTSPTKIVSQSGAQLVGGNQTGHWSLQVYQSSVTVVDPLGNMREFEMSAPMANPFTSVSLGCASNNATNCTATIRNLKVSKVAF
jgi:hypothetical protein